MNQSLIRLNQNLHNRYVESGKLGKPTKAGLDRIKRRPVKVQCERHTVLPSKEKLIFSNRISNHVVISDSFECYHPRKTWRVHQKVSRQTKIGFIYSCISFKLTEPEVKSAPANYCLGRLKSGWYFLRKKPSYSLINYLFSISLLRWADFLSIFYGHPYSIIRKNGDLLYTLASERIFNNNLGRTESYRRLNKKLWNLEFLPTKPKASNRSIASRR